MSRIWTYFLAGFSAGGLVILLGPYYPPLLGIGNGFLMGIVVSVIGFSRTSKWRSLAAVPLCGITYVIALIIFSAVAGYSPQWFGVKASSDIVHFGPDIWIGLVAAALVSAVGTSMVVPLFSMRWNGQVLVHLAGIGVAAIGITYLVNLSFRLYWSFLGVLLPVGNALFCAVLAYHLTPKISPR